ncbi:FAD-dependent oxidoreductase [Sphingomonas sp. ASV193]|uniref:FAD-dependent oxidoreductase n=1 Tax=Sphingomonas sp. ASV193 TaxID=3144405 RepID=UPI0032E88EF5
MLLDRRQFALSSTAVLGGCATVGTPRIADCSPLARVEVDPSRVIRTVAGLRPVRRQGFVVKREPLGDKALVHNYRHGGGGITMSWGTSKLAAELGLPGHSGPVAVIGSGVVGLSMARLVQEAGLPVTVYAAALPPETTSNVAGGQFHPFRVYSEDYVDDAFRAQFARALDYSWRRFQIMVGDDYGIRWLPTYIESDAPEAKPIASFPPVNRLLGRGEHPFPLDSVVRFDTMYVEVGRYLRQMIRDVMQAGGTFAVRRFAAPADLAALPERLVFNCTGIGARDLFGDTLLFPVKGQLAILEPQPEVRYAFQGRAGYMFPRPDGIVLGGTYQRDVWDTSVDPAAIAGILKSQKALFDGFRCVA